jgi:hypothetical protein
LAQTIGDPRYLWAASALGKAVAQILEAHPAKDIGSFPNENHTRENLARSFASRIIVFRGL